MSELAVRNDDFADQVAMAPRDPTGGRLVAWASGLAAAHQIGTALCGTSFAPKHFQGKPEEAAAAIMFGDEIGLTPTQALRSIYVISGTPALYARAMVALVLSRGHEIWTAEDTPSRVTVCGRRRGSPVIEEVTWTTDRARKAGYTSNKRYEQDPQAMLFARASGDVARRVAPDVLAGVAYTVEEMELSETPTKTIRRQPETAGDRVMARAKKMALEPELDEPQPNRPPPHLSEPERAALIEAHKEAADVEAAFEQGQKGETAKPDAKDPRLPPETASRPQMRMMHAEFNRQGISDRTERLAYCSGVIEREITSTDQLTKDDATRIIDALTITETAPGDPDEPS